MVMVMVMVIVIVLTTIIPPFTIKWFHERYSHLLESD